MRERLVTERGRERKREKEREREREMLVTLCERMARNYARERVGT